MKNLTRIFPLMFFSLILMTGCFRQRAPELSGPTYLEEGLIAYDQGHYDEALKHFEDALKIDPENTEAHFKRGVIFQKQNRLNDAIAAYRETVRIDRSHLKAHYNLANLYNYEKSNTLQAVFHYRRFLAVAPAHPLSRKARKQLAKLTAVPGEKKFQHNRITLDETAPARDVLAGELIQPPTIPPKLPPFPLPVQPAGEEASFSSVVCIKGEAGRGKAGRKKVEGSGFLIGKGGYILASRHQVERATGLTARFLGGETYPATLLSVSEPLDLALLQIPLQGGQALLFDQESSPKVGESVVAVGCPLGLNHSASQGIISAPERRLGGMRLLQTDVAINPGNSGGPLLNKKGEVSGVVVGVLPNARGIAFALPAEEVRRFLGATFFQIGNLFAEAKRYDESADALLISLKFWSKSAKAHSNLGEVYRRMKRFKEAEAAFLKAVSYDAQHADAQYNLGILYDNHLGDRKKAAMHYQNYLKLRPTSADAPEVTKWLAATEAEQ